MGADDTLAAFSFSLLNEAVIAFLEWGAARTPQRNEAAVAALAPPGRADDLIEAVLGIIKTSDGVRIQATSLTDPSAAPEYKSKLKALLPGLSEQAVDALASRWFFNALW